MKQQMDLNLLKVLRVLIEVRNTRKAAEQLHISQPAVSRALSRLREHFNDPLFIRNAHGLTPTSKAEEIGARLPTALDMLYDVLEGNNDFDPAHIYGKVTVAINGFISQWLAPPLIRRINKLAPNAELHLVNWESSTPNMLVDGRIQIGVNYFPSEVTKQLVQQKIDHDSFVILCRKDHPFNQSVIVPEDFNHYPLASQLIPNWNEQQNHTTELLKDYDVFPRNQLRSSQLSIILQALRDTNMLFPCSVRTAKVVGPDFKAIQICPDLPVFNGDFALIMANKSRRHPLSLWLKEQINAAIADADSQ